MCREYLRQSFTLCLFAEIKLSIIISNVLVKIQLVNLEYCNPAYLFDWEECQSLVPFNVIPVRKKDIKPKVLNQPGILPLIITNKKQTYLSQNECHTT